MPNARIVLEPVVSECTVMKEIEDGIGGVMDEVIAALTRPLSAEEIAPKPKAIEKLSRTVFKGNLEEVNRFFYKRGWTDGLPVIPPTEEAVAEMLAGTDLKPDYVVAELIPRRGKATVEKIAINAVMAGALPTYLPLLIAGVKAMAQSGTADMMAVSTGSWSPFWVINGPVRKDLNLNSSYGAMNPGDMANATIGRALGLITKNIRGIRKGMEDMGVLGNPGKYSMVAAENEEENPWEPLHVEHGFKKDDSTIALMFPNNYNQIYPYGTDDQGLLKSIVYNIIPIRMGIQGVILTPNNAAALAKAGMTKRDIKEYVMQNSTVDWERYDKHSPDYKAPSAKPAGQDLFRIVAPTRRAPDPVQILVFGGYGSWLGLTNGGPDITLAKAELPANWDKLVKKYKDVVPAYAGY
jgi:hypothetical protein